MQNALRLHEHLDFINLDIEEPARFDELKSLVDHGRGINGHLMPHVPGRMPEGVLQGHLLELLSRVAAERAAGSGQQYFPDPVLLVASETLKDGRVLRVDRQYLDALARGERHDDVPRTDQRLLVCERNVLALANCRDGRLNAYHADNPCDQRLCLGLGRNFD